MSTGNGYRDVLAIPAARSLVLAGAVSQTGDWLYNAALLAYVYVATGSAAWLGVATVVRLVPYALLSPFGGVVADRYSRRSVLLAGDLSRCAVMLAMAAVVAAHGPILAVLSLTALASALASAERPAALAWLPRLVGVSHLGSANALLHTVQDLGVVVGPALGAVLLLHASAPAVFLANAASFAASAALIGSIRRSGETPREHGSTGVARQLADGLRATRSTTYVVPLVVTVTLVELVYGAQTVQLVLYADRVSTAGPGGYGYLLAASGLGGLLSAVVNGRLASSSRTSELVVGAAALSCATQLVFAVTDVVAVAWLAALVGGFALVVCEVVAETAVARISPSDSLGRILGVMTASAVGSMIVGALLAAVLVDRLSLTASLLVTGVGTLVVALLCLVRLRGLDEVSSRGTDALAERLALLDPVPVLAGIPRPGLERLASAAVTCSLPEGVDVVLQGAPAHAFYVILHGEVAVHRDGKRVAVLGDGDHFGERGILDAAPRNATVTTTAPCTLVRLSADVLLDVLQAAPHLRSTLDRSNVGAAGSAPVEWDRLVDDVAWQHEGRPS